VAASGIGNFGLGVAVFYLNFVYRALGFDEVAIGALNGVAAIGAVLGAWPATIFARSYSRRTALLFGGVVTAVGVVVVIAFDPLPAQLAAAVLLGAGGIVVYSSGAALMADATASADRPRRFGQQIALATIAGFASAYLAGQLADPASLALHAAPGSLPVVRTLVAAGGVIAALSAVPILFVRSVAVAPHALETTSRRGLLIRFGIVEAIFGFGAGSFLPFVNLFFADRFGLSFGAIGLALGAIAVGGSLGALLHGIHLAPRLGELRAVVAVQLLSVPFALLAGIVPASAIAASLLAVRAGLMYGSASTWRAFQLSSFGPAERAGTFALFAIAWNATAALGSLVSGAVRASLGDAGWTVNIATLAAAYVVAAMVTLVFFHAHRPSGDVLAGPLPDIAVTPVPHSPA
jgi:predicted MFS family arabinose efflux permease